MVDTYINDHHLDVADDQNSITVRLSNVDVTIGHSNGPAPTAVHSLSSAHVILMTEEKKKKRRRH